MVLLELRGQHGRYIDPHALSLRPAEAPLTQINANR
jgi:hypothetical protein